MIMIMTFSQSKKKRNIFENNSKSKEIVWTSGTQTEENGVTLIYMLPIINSSFIRPAIYFNTAVSCGAAVCAMARKRNETCTQPLLLPQIGRGASRFIIFRVEPAIGTGSPRYLSNGTNRILWQHQIYRLWGIGKWQMSTVDTSSSDPLKKGKWTARRPTITFTKSSHEPIQMEYSFLPMCEKNIGKWKQSKSKKKQKYRASNRCWMNSLSRVIKKNVLHQIRTSGCYYIVNWALFALEMK